MRLRSAKSFSLIGYQLYEEVGILHSWRTIEAAQQEKSYLAILLYN